MLQTNYNIIDDFINLIDLSIQTGNINYVYNAIKKYKNLVNETYITWANNIIIELTQESIDTMVIN